MLPLRALQWSQERQKITDSLRADAAPHGVQVRSANEVSFRSSKLNISSTAATSHRLNINSPYETTSVHKTSARRVDLPCRALAQGMPVRIKQADFVSKLARDGFHSFDEQGLHVIAQIPVR